MKQGIYTIAEHTTLARDVRRMVLAGDTSALTRPGQFVNLLVEGCYLRRPISVADWDGESLTLIYKVVGRGTGRLARMLPGERLDLLTGLGNGFDPAAGAGEALLVGGGAGVWASTRPAKRSGSKRCRRREPVRSSPRPTARWGSGGW